MTARSWLVALAPLLAASACSSGATQQLPYANTSASTPVAHVPLAALSSAPPSRAPTEETPVPPAPNPPSTPAPARKPDWQIANDVRQALLHNRVTRWARVTTTVDEGAVTLHGAADSSDQREALTRTVSRVPGVQETFVDVTLPVAYRRDAVIAADVRRRLDEDRRIGSARVGVAVNRKNVTLTGVTSDLFQRDAAVADAWTAGAGDVDAGALRVGPPAGERASAQIAGRYLAALASPGFVDLEAELHPEAHGFFPGLASADGSHGVIALHEQLFSAFGGRTFAATRVLSTKRNVIVQWTMTGSQDRTWMQLPPTHATARLRGLTALWVDADGAVTEIHVYFDVGAAASQLQGKGAQPPAAVATPTAAPQSVVEQGTGMETDNSATMRAVVDALEGDSEEAYAAYVADDATFFLPRGPGTAGGKGAASAFYERLHGALGELETSISNLWPIGHFVVTEYSIAGVQLRPLDSQPLIPYRVVRLHMVDVAELRDGRIIRLWRYENPSEIEREP